MSRDGWLVVNVVCLVMLGVEMVLSFVSVAYGFGLSFHPQFWSGLFLGCLFVWSLYKGGVVKV